MPVTHLTDEQVAVANLFFSLPESGDFLLAGGGALIAHGIVARPTRDLDLFLTRRHGTVQAATRALARAAVDQGWSVSVVRESDTFSQVRLTIGRQDCQVDLALDAPPESPPIATFAGPAFSVEDLACRKMGALFSRASPRDFTDVHALALLLGRRLVYEAAAARDRGFHAAALLDAFGAIRRWRDDEFPRGSDVPAVRAYFADWADEIRCKG